MQKFNLKENISWIIPSFITILGFVFSNYIIGIIFLNISIFYLIYHFFGNYIINLYRKNILNKILFYAFVLILPLLFIFSYTFFTKPKIFNYLNGYELKFKDNFDGHTLVDSDFRWIYEDVNNEFTNNQIGSKILNSSAYIQRGYGMFQDLKKLDGDRILLGKFHLKEGGKIGIRFMNTKGFDSNDIQTKHNNECILQFHDSNSTSIGYGHHVTKNTFQGGESSFNNFNLSNGNYYILAKIFGRKFSCYYQKEGDNAIYPIIENKDIIFENLGGPVITKFIQGTKYSPEILSFSIYTKKD